MHVPRVPARPGRIHRLGALGGPLLFVVLALGGGMAGCSTGHGGEATAGGGSATGAPGASMAASMAATMTPAAAPTSAVPMGAMHMPTPAEVTDTWQARPDYVRALPPEWQTAYAFALARPDVLQWLPCYCGCTGAGHRSNLDCFFQRREVPGSYVYEEHASFCDICVKTANLASQMLQEGRTMVQIRAAVDTTFGTGAAPGTDTPLPPS
jgi:hypothetical protein